MNEKSKIQASNNKASDIETIKEKRTPPPPPPNYRQSLQFIDNAVSMAPLNRQAHIQVQQAMQQLSGAIAELERLNEKQ